MVLSQGTPLSGRQPSDRLAFVFAFSYKVTIPMDPFLTQLATLCGTRRTATKWVLVPSLSLGHTLGERLAYEGTDWVNLRFTTPDALAFQMAAPFMIERQEDPAPDGVGPALIMRLLMELPPDGPRYFRHLAEHPKMAEALWRTIQELRMAGLGAAGLSSTAFSNANKHGEFVALLMAYEEYFRKNRLADRAAVFQEALQHPEGCPILADDTRIELPDMIWEPLQRRLIDQLPGQGILPDGLEIPGLAISERADGLSSPARRVRLTPGRDSERLAFLLRPADAPAPYNDGTLQLFRAGTKEAEVEEVFRRIVQTRCPLDQVEIGCASQDYLALVWEKARRHEWPITVGPGIPITWTAPARALLAFCAWVESGFPAGSLRRLLQSGDVQLGFVDGTTPGQVARLLARSDATWGRQTYAVALSGMASIFRERAADVEADDEVRAHDEVRATQAERLADWIRRLLALVPERASTDLHPLGPWLDAASTFIGTFAVKRTDLDHAAAAELVQALDELRVLADLPRSQTEALELIKSRLEGLTVGSDRARPGYLSVTSLSEVGYCGRGHTFVLGLEEGGVVPTLLEDAVLLDRERERICPTLPTSQDRVTEALRRIASRLASLSGRVCLSFACQNAREDRETFPSWLLLQAIRVLKPNRAWTYNDLNDELGSPASVVPPDPDQALGEADWWMASVRGQGLRARPLVLAAFPGLAEGEQAEAARASDAFTPYDGWVPAAGPALDPRSSGRAVSPTSLEGLATCPFQYFLRRGLGIKPVEDVEPDPDTWLDVLTRGSLLHELYARVLRALSTRQENPDPARHASWLRQLGEEALARHRALVPPPSEQVFAREAEEFLNDLQLFLQFEAESRTREPVGLEVAFGAGDDLQDPLDRPEPVTIELANGQRVQLRGRIDRLDKLPDGTYEVVDYKTGRLRLPGGLGATYAGGRQLQHALYALAAAQLLRACDQGARVVRSGYYFPTTRGRGERVIRPVASPSDLQAVLRDLFDLLAAGAFVHTPNSDDCRYCEFPRACGREPVQRAKPKIENAHNAVLEPYRRLAAHE